MPGRGSEDPVENSLHDLANALAAARSYGDVLQLRSRSATTQDLEPLIQNLLEEIDRANDLLKSFRRETYAKGDVIRCVRCNYTFVYRKRIGTDGRCRRCNSSELVRWKPTG